MKTGIVSAKFRLAKQTDKHLDTYDNTKLVAYCTCPTWGVMIYQMNKVMPGGGRNLALECGSTMHEVFAWVRLVSLWHHNLPMELIDHHGVRLFGKNRFNEIMSEAFKEGGGDEVEMVTKRGAIAVLESSAYYDDPRDKRRTLANMEECALAYIDKWEWRNLIWVRDLNDPKSDVGIEIPFDLVVLVELENGGLYEWRYTGKIDGICYKHTSNKLCIEDNKTASRLGEAWSAQWPLSSQVTGYCLAAGVFVGEPIHDATIHGLTIPLPKTYDYGGITQEYTTREQHHFTRWVEWFVQIAKGYERDKNNPYDALRFSHSCSRYFHPCSLLPWCDSSDEDQKEMLTQMVDQEWSPLHEIGSE